MKQRLIVKMLSDRGHYGFAVSENGAEVYLDRNTMMTVPGLYVGREIWARVEPPKFGKNPVARDVQLNAPKQTPADYNPPLSPEEEVLWKLFVELKAQYHTLRLSRPLPALDESVKSWARELAEEFIERKSQ